MFANPVQIISLSQPSSFIAIKTHSHLNRSITTIIIIIVTINIINFISQQFKTSLLLCFFTKKIYPDPSAAQFLWSISSTEDNLYPPSIKSLPFLYVVFFCTYFVLPQWIFCFLQTCAERKKHLEKRAYTGHSIQKQICLLCSVQLTTKQTSARKWMNCVYVFPFIKYVFHLPNSKRVVFVMCSYIFFIYQTTTTTTTAATTQPTS